MTGNDDDNRCGCGAVCPTGHLIGMAERKALEEAFVTIGIAQGNLENVEAQVEAIRYGAEAFGWFATYTMALAKHGPNWAAEVAGPRPNIHCPGCRCDRSEDR